MSAFGDAMVFLAAFGVSSIPATCALLFFLRPVRLFWRFAAVVSLTIAATAIPALVGSITPIQTDATSFPGAAAGLAPIRVLLAPLFGLAFLLSLFFAPTRPSRLAFLGATLVEALVFVWVVLHWILSAR
jgi:hypothetical protein